MPLGDKKSLKRWGASPMANAVIEGRLKASDYAKTLGTDVGAEETAGWLVAAKKYSDAKKAGASEAELRKLHDRMASEWFVMRGQAQGEARREAKKRGYDID